MSKHLFQFYKYTLLECWVVRVSPIALFPTSCIERCTRIDICLISVIDFFDPIGCVNCVVAGAKNGE